MDKNTLTKILKSILRLLFIFACIFMVIFMCYLQYENYRSNQDSSSVSYKRFVGDDEDIYPTFSVCFHGNGGQIFKSYNMDRLESCLSPCANESYWKNNSLECERKCKNDDYFEVISGAKMDDKNRILNSQRSSYEDKIVDVASTILKFETATTSGKIIRHIENERQGQEKFTSTFDMTYQDPWNLCFTKRQTRNQQELLRYDYLELKDGKNYLNIGGYDYRIYVHQKGQLLRRLGMNDHFIRKKPFKDQSKESKVNKLTTKGKHYDLVKKLQGYSFEVNVRINSATVLRKRSDAIAPCNNTLLNEDSHWIKTAIQKLGCIPPFLKRYDNDGNTNEDYSCKKNQYEDYKMNYNPEHYFYKIGRLYDNPCTAMTPLVTSTMVKVLNIDDSSYEEESISEDNREKRNAASNSKGNKKGSKKNKNRKNGNKGEGEITTMSQVSEPEITSKLPCLNDSYEDPKCFMKVKVKIEYIADGYTETINHRAFTILSLLSQIGGFIGMFLGYSLLHLPQFAVFIANAAKSMVSKKENKGAKMAWNNIKRKKTPSKMNLVNVKGSFHQKVKYTSS